MSLQTSIRTSFNGGIAPDTKSGMTNSCRFSRYLDIHSDSDSVTLMPKSTKISSTTVVDLIKDFTDGRPYNSSRYGLGDAGHLYQIASNDTVTDLRTVSGCAGQGLIVFEDYVYYAGSTAIGRYGKLTGTPAFNDDYFSDDVQDLDLSVSLSGQTYTTPTSITESAANQIDIVPTKTPLKAIDLTLTAEGTGTVTVTVHDNDDVSIGTASLAPASTANGVNTFTFATPLRVQPGKDYHIHVTSTVADTTVQTGTTIDLSTAWYKTYFGILFSDSDYHPMILHTNGVTGIIAIGNGNYIATYDNDTYNPNKIALEPGYKVRGWSREDEFIIAYCWKGDSIEDYEEGKMFYWDGISNYYNYMKPINGGQPNSMINFKNRTFSVLGNRGDMTLGTEPFKKIQGVPALARGKKVEVMPKAMCIWQDKVYMGVANTDDSAFEQGIYEFGTDSDRAVSYQAVSTEVLNFAFRMSPNDTTGTDQKIGALFPTGNAMYMGWKNGSTYGIDKVSKSGSAETTGSWEALINDVGISGKTLTQMPQKTKMAVKLVITFDALPSGCTVTPKFRMDRASSFTTGTAATAGSRRAELVFASQATSTRYKEIELGFDITSGGNFPTITGLFYSFDPLTDEIDES